MHRPNPFDFVPFTTPILRQAAEFDAMHQEKVSGFIELKVKALTPIHVVGRVDRAQPASHSHFYIQDGEACIPAATIRGCLRSFIEPLTSGWASQMSPEYPKVYGGTRNAKGRHVGFRTFDEYEPVHTGVPRRISPPALDRAFQPGSDAEGRIDLASYLFGIVTEGQAEGDARALKGKLWIEDARIESGNIVSDRYWMPDVGGDAFMGGAKPSASNWWYMQPEQIWNRHTLGHDIAEFIGDKFWGRKFYYHQDPVQCVPHYDDEAGGEWRYAAQRPFHRVWLECLDAGRATRTFPLYFENLPRSLLTLLVKVLQPGENIRHKLGYAKAYGYGSLEFETGHVWRRVEKPGRVPDPLKAYNYTPLTWRQLVGTELGPLIDTKALAWLAWILGWQDHEQLLFMYPPFTFHNFATPVTYDDLRHYAPASIAVRDPMHVSPTEARQIAKALFDFKRPIHFRMYQELSEGWPVISKRKP